MFITIVPMTRILSFETSTTTCGIALISEIDGVIEIFQRTVEGVSGHAEHLLPMASEVLALGGIGKDQLDAVAFGQGPGAFTGLRLACGAAFRRWEWANEAAPDEAQAKRRDLQDAPVRDFATHVLDRRLSRVAAAGEDLTGLSAADLHGLRIQCKKMRYAAEFFSILYSARASRRFLRRIAALQDRLGRLNDAAVAADLMSVLGGGGDRGYAVGVVRGFIAAGQRGARGKAERAWRKFRRVNAFWA